MRDPIILESGQYLVVYIGEGHQEEFSIVDDETAALLKLQGHRVVARSKGGDADDD